MKKIIKTAVTTSLVGVLALGLAGCRDAEMASYNLSKEADQFKVVRKITLINTITDEVLYTVEGNMSVYADSQDNQLEITAKVGEDKYEKHFLGLSPTTVYIIEQLEPRETDVYRFQIIVKPSALIPDLELVN